MQKNTAKTSSIFIQPIVVIPVAIIAAIIIGVVSYKKLNTSADYATTTVALGNVSSSISTTGTVKAATETSLAFPKGGRVASVSATVGTHVSAGETLASLDSTSEEGAVETAQGAYQAAQANYALLVNGASASDLAIAKLNYSTTVSEEALAVSEAQQKLLSTDLTAVATTSSNTLTPPVISGTYNGTAEGTITIQVYGSGSNGYFTSSGLVTATGNVDSQTPQPLGSSGLSILFPEADGSQYVSTSWTIAIPNTIGPNYTADNAAYQAALQDQTDKVAEAQAALDKVQAAPRTEDLAAAQAQVTSAEGALQAANGALADDFITAPFDGIITSVSDITAGSIVSANTPVINIISEGAFQIESYVSEKDLSLVTVGEPVSITTDAYGPSVVFKGTVIEVDPAATPEPNGELGYKVTYQFTNTDSRIKPGITATVTINGQEKENVLQVPTTAVYLKNGQSFVLVRKGDTNQEQAVVTGVAGENNIEIVSGLTAGEQVVTLGNN